MTRPEWRNRIKELRTVHADELQRNPLNFRRHPDAQRDALRGVLDEVGIAGAIVCYEDATYGLTLIDGELRVNQGGAWPALILDVTRDEANLLLATYDPLGALAITDAETLDALLREVRTGDAAVQQLLADLAEGAGVVPVAADDQPSHAIAEQWMVIIECDDETQQVALLDRLSAEGLTCRALTS